MIPLCGNHGFSFCCLVYGYVVGWPTILFYYIELHIQEYISNKKNGPLVKTTIFIGLLQQPTNQ